MGNKKERKALKEASKKATEVKKASKAEVRKEIATRNAEQKGGLPFGHHCPHKEQAKTHAINKTCIKKHHVAYCPNCYNLVSYLYGCSVCKYKGTELEDKRPLDYLDIVKYRKAQGLLGPRGLHARTADESTEGQDEEGNQDSDHDDDNDPDELYGAMARLERMLAKEETEEATTPIQANPNQPARRRRRANEI